MYLIVRSINGGFQAGRSINGGSSRKERVFVVKLRNSLIGDRGLLYVCM